MAEHPRATGALKEFIHREAERILGACTRCGKCVEACPMARYSSPLAGADPQAVATGILSVLREEPGTPEALGWASVCVRSGMCVPACPEDVNPIQQYRGDAIVVPGRGGRHWGKACIIHPTRSAPHTR